ncbi:MAG: RNA methyltransferase [Candidatus Bipolaricaulota bacterium]|nr:RNA methyltransferase [Candidatus Bipolaricaulota bacterium]MDW8126915.1 RNA methyltransferase [Candidatus Bipolaricaulota bacterium]
MASRLASLAVVCANLQDPHNAAAIVRTCEALGILEVYVIEEDHPFLPSPRVTQGAEKWVRLRRFRRAEPALLELRDRGFRIFAAMPVGKMPVEELPVDGPLALVFGNETEGVGPQILAHCDGTFRIPMWGFSQSLNVSVAAGISLYLAARSRRQARGQDGDLSPMEQEALLAEYMARQEHKERGG